MPFTLDQVVPWGRSYDEYCRMFALTERELSGPILGCGDGPASFNAEATARGVRVISCDPLYQFSAAAIAARIDATAPVIMGQTRRHQEQFVWQEFASPEALYEARLAAMGRFLDDYPAGGREGRYVAAALPQLPFADQSFDLALCSHFLFLYTEQLSLDFHLQAAAELCRVAREVRLFPLLDLDARESPWVAPVIAASQEADYHVFRQKVPYEFQRGGDTALFIRS